MKENIRFIGLIRTPFQQEAGTPIQPITSQGAAGEVEIFPEYRAALADVAGFERIWLIFWCHLAKDYKLKVIPYRDTVERGLFATRAPSRPNPIAISAVRLLDIDEENGILKIGDVDMLDGTPVIDIKPYVPSFDSYPHAKFGWLENAKINAEKADNRFTEQEK